MASTPDRFRAGMGRWTTGVTIVTSRAGDRPVGMTVSDFCGVSLDPQLVLVCAAKTAETHGHIARAGFFAVNLLAEGQQELSSRFAKKGNEAVRFDGLDCETAVTGAPLIPGALASFDCTVQSAHDEGDHIIYVGAVQDIRLLDGAPLLYHAGSYGRFQAA